MKIGVTVVKTSRRSMSVLICHPSRYVVKKRYLYLYMMGTIGITAMPRSFCHLPLTSYILEPHVLTNGKPTPFFLLFFQTKLSSLMYFFGSLHRLYLEQAKAGGGAGFPFVGWCMINTTVSKNHIQVQSKST